jgi:type II secretory pathway component PulF
MVNKKKTSMVDVIKNNVLFSAQDKIDICDTVALLLQDGLTIKQISEDFVKYGTVNQKRVGQAMLHQMQAGQQISEGLKPFFGHLAMQAIQTSEKSKRLAEGFEQAKETLTTTSGIGMRLLSMWKSELIQLVIFLALFVQMGNSAWPSLIRMVPPARWPALATGLKAFSDWLAAYYIVAAIGLIAGILVFNLMLRMLTGPVRDALDSLPMFSQYRLAVASNTLYTMAMMLKTGASLRDAIARCKYGATRYQCWKISLIEKRFVDSRSSNLGELLDVGLLERRQINRLILLSGGGSRGTLNAKRLERSAQYHSSTLEKLITKVGPTVALLIKATGSILIVLLVLSIQLLASSMS